MQSVDDSNAFVRIQVALEAYRLQASHFEYLAVGKFESLDVYLKSHLSTDDWELWSCQEAQATLLNTSMNLQAFKRLLRQYKRTGYEYLQRCDLANQP